MGVTELLEVRVSFCSWRFTCTLLLRRSFLTWCPASEKQITLGQKDLQREPSSCACPGDASSALEGEAKKQSQELFPSQKRARDHSSGLLTLVDKCLHITFIPSTDLELTWLKSKSYTNTGLLCNLGQPFKLSQSQSPIQVLTGTDPA